MVQDFYDIGLQLLGNRWRRGGFTIFIPFKTAWTLSALEMALWVSVFPVPVLDGKAGIKGEDVGVPSAASKLLELLNPC